MRSAAYRSNVAMLAVFEAKNNTYLQKLITEHKVLLRRFPDDMLKSFKRYTKEVLQEVKAKDTMSRKVTTPSVAFRKMSPNGPMCRRSPTIR